jgi:hypothetical protein
MLLKLIFKDPVIVIGQNMKKELPKTEIRWKVIEDLAQEEGRRGFIWEYALYKLKRVDEPKREGTPKGEKIGFTGKKHFASILVGIKNDKLKDIAKQSEVSYGLLRKWKTEPDFQGAAENHCSEFVAEIVKRIRNHLKKQTKSFEDFYDGHGPDPMRKDLKRPLNACERVFVDAHLFSDRVLEKLAEAAQTIDREANGKEGDDFFFRYGIIKSILDVIAYSKNKGSSLHHPLVIKLFVSEVKEIISNERTLSKKEQKRAVHNLTFIENELGALHEFLKEI